MPYEYAIQISYKNNKLYRYYISNFNNYFLIKNLKV